MSVSREKYTPYIGPFSSIEAVNESSTQGSPFGTNVGIHPGDLGTRTILTQAGVGSKEYQKVQLDSGATSATGVGVTAAGQLAYWKDKSKYLVTNDFLQAIGGQSANTAFRNEVAGMFTTAVTAGNQTWIQQKGNTTVLKSKSLTGVAGYWLVSDNTASTAQADIVATGTAPTVQSIGKNNTVGAAQTTLNADLDIPGIP